MKEKFVCPSLKIRNTHFDKVMWWFLDLIFFHLIFRYNAGQYMQYFVIVFFLFSGTMFRSNCIHIVLADIVKNGYSAHFFYIANANGIAKSSASMDPNCWTMCSILWMFYFIFRYNVGQCTMFRGREEFIRLSERPMGNPWLWRQRGSRGVLWWVRSCGECRV